MVKIAEGHILDGADMHLLRKCSKHFFKPDD